MKYVLLFLLIVKTSFSANIFDNQLEESATKLRINQTERVKNTQQKKKNNQEKKKKQEEKPQQENEYKIAREGIGIGNIVVGKSTMDDAIKEFGKNYKWIVHKNYSYQMSYSNGISFYICQSDKKKQIFDIEIKVPYKAKTRRGIILGKSTVEDVYKLYGKSKSGLEYKGVHFYYTNQGGKKVITTIDIVEPTGLRQCDKLKK